mgnify:CR=1 FL=1
MATNPDALLSDVQFVTKIVKSGSTVVKGVGVKVSSNGESEVDVAGAGDKAYAVAQATVVGDGVKTVECALLNSAGIIPVKASGTATAGEYAICGSDGFENQTLGGGTTVRYIAGRFTQAGVDNDFVGLMPGCFAGVSS